MQDKIPNNSIDLIYLDPPFNSNRNYNRIYSTNTGLPVPEEAIAFCDAWELTQEKEDDIKAFNETLITDGNEAFAGFWTAWVNALRYQNPQILSYLVFMAQRLWVMRAKLKNTGSLFLHCDPTASHYIKIILDGIFGHKNFRNEIIWQRTKNPKGSQFKAKKFGASTDTIFWYTKTENYYFELNSIKTQLNDKELAKKYHEIDEKGRYYNGPIECGPSMGDRPNLCYEYKGYNNRYKSGWRMTKEKLTELDNKGDLGWSSTGRPFRKLRPDDDNGFPISNLWNDINRLYSSTEKLGYPTQKPVALLERIIKSCTKEGDIVLDPFCGCGTTLDAAQNLNRKWIGIDICMLSTSLMEQRLLTKYAHLKRGKDYTIDGMPVTMEQVKELISKSEKSKNEGRYQFQYWAVEKVKGFASTKKSGDGGIDGSIYFYKDDKKNMGKMILSVKSDKKLQASYIRDLVGTMENNKAEMAGLISYAKPTDEMLAEARRAGMYQLDTGNLFGVMEYPRIQILTAEEILEGKNFNIPSTQVIKKHA